MSKESLEAWLKSGKYLPKCLRDFHDQKDVFKTMHSLVDVSDNTMCREIGWQEGHVYVIDIFLWWMAKRGYTLQKTRHKEEFHDLKAEIKARQDRETTQFKNLLLKQAQPKGPDLP